MKHKIKYIAVYRVAPIAAITHIAKIKEIGLYKDTGKYQLIFDGSSEEIKHIPLTEHGPQSRFYVEREKLLKATTLDDVW